MPKTVYNSSTPIKPNFDPVSKNSSATANCTMNYEKIYPGIYLTSVKDLCAPDDLKIYGFTHIIYIDKHHIIARHNGQHQMASSHEKCGAPNRNQHVPSQTHQNRHKHAENNDEDDDGESGNEKVKKGLSTSVTASITIRQTAAGTSILASTSGRTGPTNCDNNDTMINRSLCATNIKVQDSAGSSAGCSTSIMSFAHEMPVDDEPLTTTNATTISSTSAAAASSSASSLLYSKHYPSNENLFGHSDFATLDLNFGESTYFTANVLPNCYKAVAFIENALKNNGAVLVIDCIGEHQKCVTIVIGFLMYKYNKNFL